MESWKVQSFPAPVRATTSSSDNAFHSQPLRRIPTITLTRTSWRPPPVVSDTSGLASSLGGTEIPRRSFLAQSRSPSDQRRANPRCGGVSIAVPPTQGGRCRVFGGSRRSSSREHRQIVRPGIELARSRFLSVAWTGIGTSAGRKRPTVTRSRKTPFRPTVSVRSTRT